MRKYTSFKQVSAEPIETVIPAAHRKGSDERDTVVLSDGTTHTIEGLFSRYTPVPGDFLVVYEDGYTAVSPRQPFLAGYTLLASEA